MSDSFTIARRNYLTGRGLDCWISLILNYLALASGSLARRLLKVERFPVVASITSEATRFVRPVDAPPPNGVPVAPLCHRHAGFDDGIVVAGAGRDACPRLLPLKQPVGDVLHMNFNSVFI